jgi:RecB family endonuclease NucS
VPVSPFKPAQMDRADICYFSDQLINRGTIPDVVIELKNKHANQTAVDQVVRYVHWLHRIAGDKADSIRAYLFAPSFARNVHVSAFAAQIALMTPGGPVTT